MDLEYSEVARKRLALVDLTAISPPSGVILRRGRREDYDGIREMTEMTMKGVDFIASNYMQYIEDPDRYVYVAEKEGKIIACAVHYIVDGGRTLFSGGARRDPAYRGQALFEALRRHAYLCTLTARPTVEKIRGSSPHIEFQKEKTKSSSFRQLLPGSSKSLVFIAQSVQSRAFAFINQPQLVSEFLKHGVDKTLVNFASEDDLKRIFTNTHLKERVFPGNSLQAGMEVFEPRVENLKALFQNNREFTVSKDLSSVVISQFWQSQVGSVFNLKLHGEASADMAMAHFLRLAERFLDSCPAGKLLSVIYGIPKTVPKENLILLCKVMLPFYREKTDFFEEIVSFESFIPPLHHL